MVPFHTNRAQIYKHFQATTAIDVAGQQKRIGIKNYRQLTHFYVFNVFQRQHDLVLYTKSSSHLYRF